MTTPRNIAVFIDFENFGQDDSFDAHAVIERLKEKGRLLIKRAYADWGRFAKYKRMMLENSIELTEMPSHGGRGKNSADIQLVVDALEIALTRDYIDTFVVVSGDSDFTPLISKLRMQGKYVIVVGEQRQLSGLIKGYCDELIYYRTLIGGPQKVEVGSGEMEAALGLLQRAVTLLEKDGSEPRGSQVKTIMRQLDPSFDEANSGFSQFRRFLKAARDKGLIRMSEMDSGGDVLVSSSSNSLRGSGESGSRRSDGSRRRSEGFNDERHSGEDARRDERGDRGEEFEAGRAEGERGARRGRGRGRAGRDDERGGEERGGEERSREERGQGGRRDEEDRAEEPIRRERVRREVVKRPGMPPVAAGVQATEPESSSGAEPDGAGADSFAPAAVSSSIQPVEELAAAPQSAAESISVPPGDGPASAPSEVVPAAAKKVARKRTTTPRAATARSPRKRAGQGPSPIGPDSETPPAPATE